MFRTAVLASDDKVWSDYINGTKINLAALGSLESEKDPNVHQWKNR